MSAGACCSICLASAELAAKDSATFLPVFSGYAPDAVAVRLADADAKAMVCADGFWRRGRPVDGWLVGSA